MAGKIRYLDSRPDEQLRGITMESSAISLYFSMLRRAASTITTPPAATTTTTAAETRQPRPPSPPQPAQPLPPPTPPASAPTEEKEYLINLIDSPGHIDFSSEVSVASRLCDGAVVLIDAAEGVCSQTVSALRQTWTGRLRPLLVINKLDRLATELRMSPAEAYVHLARLLEQVNAVVGSFFQGERMEQDLKERERAERRARRARSEQHGSAAASASPSPPPPSSADPLAAKTGGDASHYQRQGQQRDQQSQKGQRQGQPANETNEVNGEGHNGSSNGSISGGAATADIDGDDDDDDDLDHDDDSDIYFAPEKNNVIFASALDGWAFTVKQFAALYERKLGMKRAVLERVLWGDYYLDPKTKRVLTGAKLQQQQQQQRKQAKAGKALKPMFVQLVLENIWAVYEATTGRGNGKGWVKAFRLFCPSFPFP
jgi:ribosome assembly protein 1